MFKNSNTVKWSVLGLIILLILNALAFYLIKESIGIADSIEHAENESVKNSLQQKQTLSDVFPSMVFTLDIAGILFLLYILIKLFFKTLKKSRSQQS